MAATIERVEVVPFALRFREPYVTARGRLDRRELLLVRLHTRELVVGLGETGPLALRGGPSLDEIAACIGERYAPLLRGVPVSAARIGELVGELRATSDARQALAGVDLALWDLAGKLEGKPVWQLLGADAPPSVRCNATLTAGEPGQVAGQALRWAAHGFDTFKLKVGGDRDSEQVAAVREALGTAARIRIDANGVWNPAEAIARLRELAGAGIELCEQPTRSLEEMKQVRAAVEVPIAADESVVSAADAQLALTSGACDAVTVKIAKAGGITAAREVVAAAPTYLSSALDGPLGIAAALHLAAVLPKRGFAAGLAHGLATAELLAETVATNAGAAGPVQSAPSRPGLGIDIDVTALERCRI